MRVYACLCKSVFPRLSLKSCQGFSVCGWNEEAKAGNDEFLKSIYDMYYLGHINVKELQVALKAHRSKDWGKVGTQLKTKIQLYFKI